VNSYQTAYNLRRNAELLARQAPEVKKLVKEVLDELKSIEQSLYWALDADDGASDMWPASMIEHAHTLVDLGHDYNFALKAFPPPKDEDAA
jgi:hypothetical protein